MTVGEAATLEELIRRATTVDEDAVGAPPRAQSRRRDKGSTLPFGPIASSAPVPPRPQISADDDADQAEHIG